MTTPRYLTRLPALAAAAALAAGLSACGAASDGYGDTAAGGAPTAVADPVAATPEVGTILTASNTAQLGTVVVDGQGYTLYRFDKDSATPSASNCADECARQWPPVLATPGSPLTVEGVAQEAVGTINRSDGSIQLTLGGWPVYRYSGDDRPGATSGQGVGGTWAAVTPEGAKAADTAEAGAGTGVAPEPDGAGPDAGAGRGGG